jgi:hypothetical protein
MDDGGGPRIVTAVNAGEAAGLWPGPPTMFPADVHGGLMSGFVIPAKMVASERLSKRYRNFV